MCFLVNTPRLASWDWFSHQKTEIQLDKPCFELTQMFIPEPLQYQP